MIDDEPLAIAIDDLQLLGSFYSTDFPLVVESVDDEIRIVPPKTPWWSLAFLAVLNSAIFLAMVAFIVTNKDGESLEPLIWGGIGLAGVFAIAGPVIAYKLRLNYLVRQSPLLSLNKTANTISILAGSKQFMLADVYALVGLSLPDKQGEVVTELQVFVWDADRLTPHLINTSIFSFPKQTYGKTLREFGEHSGLLTLVANSKKISIMTPTNGESSDVSKQ
ncbi:hypothetical protein [Symmachiella dynata]|uniref:hypothetical protein n=1 Tax=Symmachiella dynata TaxID=2527995 RepID=UPI0030EF5DFC